MLKISNMRYHEFLLVMLHKTNQTPEFLQINAMFLQEDFQAGFGAEQDDSNMIHRDSQSFCNLAIALVPVISPVNQFPVAYGKLLQSGIQNCDPSRFRVRLAGWMHRYFHARAVMTIPAAFTTIIARKVARDSSQIRS